MVPANETVNGFRLHLQQNCMCRIVVCSALALSVIRGGPAGGVVPAVTRQDAVYRPRTASYYDGVAAERLADIEAFASGLSS